MDSAQPAGHPSLRPEEHRAYLDVLESRVRTSRTGALLRTVGIQGLWVAVVLAGAGVPLNQAVGGPGWVGPTLGFVVVVAAGLERVFGRTTTAATAQDVLRRRLAREQRLFEAGVEPYGGEAAFEELVRRCEIHLGEYDGVMVDYSATLARRPE